MDILDKREYSNKGSIQDYAIEDQIIEGQDELENLSLSSDSEGAGGERIYPMTNIQVERGFYTVFELKRKYDKTTRQIILDADFQRDDVWRIKQKCELVESVLMGLPLPIFYFNQNKNGKLVVVDGRQRLTALFEYMNNKFALKNLTILNELNKKKFSDLTPIQQSMIEDYQIQAHVILPPTPERIKFDIFDRVNRAGTQLNKQEIRNALYQGKATELLSKVSSSEEFSKATGDAFKNDKRMKDKYIILRFLAFYLYLNHSLKDENGNLYEYRNDIDDLLAKTMELMNELEDKELQKLEALVKSALSKSYFYLGKDAFRLIKEDGKKSAINMNLFETLIYIMTYLPEKDNKIADRVVQRVNMLLGNDIFLDAIGNHRDNINKVRSRFNMADAIGREFRID